MTEITVEALDKQKIPRGESSMQINLDEFRLRQDEYRRLRQELNRKAHTVIREARMEIQAGILNVTNNQDVGSQKWTIYRVDQNFKKLHDEATFHPKLISIGPFHHNKSDHLKPMEHHKWRFLSRFLNSMEHYDHLDAIRSSSSNPLNIKWLVTEIEKLENEARACYSETFDDLGSKEFVMMMVLDGCFILELLILFHKLKGRCRNGDDPIFTSRSVLPNLMHDLLLLENQLPFIVLRRIIELKLSPQHNITYLILNFFNTMLFRENEVLDVSRQWLNKFPDHHHLLALFRSSFQTGKANHHPPVQQPNPNALFSRNVFKRILLWRNLISRNPNDGEESDARCFGPIQAVMEGIPERRLTTVSDPQPIQAAIRIKDTQDIELKHMSIHCVAELREAGVEFKKRSCHHDLLDIEFKKGKLYIPTLYINDSTSSVFLNFIAYEQHNHSIKPNFTSYLMFLDSLVNSSQDVEHLRHTRIIDHGLGSFEDVATMFHKICKDVVQDFGDDNYLSQVFKEVNKYFGKRRNRWRAAWKHDYFRNPWAFSSFLAAVILLVLTFLQAFFSIFAYFHPPS